MSARSLCQLWSQQMTKSVDGFFDELEAETDAQLKLAGIQAERAERWLDLRYQGQSSTISIAWTDGCDVAEQFVHKHKQRFGFSLSQHAIELVTLSVWLYKDMPYPKQPLIDEGDEAQPIDYSPVAREEQDTPVYMCNMLVRGQSISGPCIILDNSGTLFIESAWQGEVLAQGHIRLQMSTDCP